MAAESPPRPATPLRWLELLGRRSVAAVEELGYHFALLVESLYWIAWGRRIRQPVRFAAALREMVSVGLNALPIVSVLSFSVGVMLAIQGIHTLKTFGAEGQVVVGIALSVTREFAPLIVAILVAGRSGSAFAARIGTMQISQEVDALRVLGINPVRYLVAPALAAMVVMLPALTFFADLLGLAGGAAYSAAELGIGLSSYAERTLQVLSVEDVVQGLVKSLVFAVLITLIGVANGFQVSGGAEGVGRATTRAVVLAIAAILVADMLFTFFMNR
ncbi:MlaE family ABC transporter permease [Endothiovibrio diazotrophicus]